MPKWALLSIIINVVLRWSDADDEHVIATACADEKIKRQMEGMQLVKTIVVKNKLVNLILKPAK